MEDALNARRVQSAEIALPSSLASALKQPTAQHELIVAITSNTQPKEGKERWSPTPGDFDSLLAALDPDRSVAASRYTGLRERLSRFFSWNRAADPDMLADLVLDRLTRRVASSNANDEAVRQPEKFAAGIARMLLREQWRDQRANAAMLVSLEAKSGSARQEQEERQRVEALSVVMDECLDRLTAEQRDLIERYYSAKARNQMDARKTLAEELSISLNALRNRAMRIRAEVERCAAARLQQD